MKVSFEHDAAHNYVIPQPEYPGKETENGEEEYEYHMLEENEISGLMKCSRKKINGGTQYYYEITSRQSLAQLCETEALHADDIRNMLRSFYQTLQQMEQYLLNPDKIVLEPELIYLDIESKEAKFCYLPSYGRMIQDSFRIFASYLLYHLEQTDTAAVLLVYELNRRVQDKNYALLEILQQETGGEEEKRVERAEFPQIQKNTEKKQNHGSQDNEQKIRKPEIHVSKRKKKSEKEAKEKETESGRTEKIVVEKKGQIIMGMLFLVVAGITGLAAWMEMLTMTQAGGITFLIAGIMGYGISMKKKGAEKTGARENSAKKAGIYKDSTEKTDAKKRRKEKKNRKESEIKWEMPESIPEQKEEITEEFQEISEEEEKVGATTVLRRAQAEYEPHITLISMNTRERNSVVLLQDSYLIGKLKSKVDICIDDTAISRIHAKIQKEGEEYYLYDMNSTNGTYLNGRRLGVNEKVPIHVADEITFAEAGYYVGKC